MFGQAIPDNGDPEFAKQLIAESGEPMPKITYDYGKTPAADKAAGAIVTALAKAGIEVTPNPLDPGGYYGIVFDDEKANELINGGWGSDWPNASTVIPELFAANGGWNLSRWKDEAFTAESDAAKEILDRAEQGNGLGRAEQAGDGAGPGDPAALHRAAAHVAVPRSAECTSGRHTAPGATPTCTSCRRLHDPRVVGWSFGPPHHHTQLPLT